MDIVKDRHGHSFRVDNWGRPAYARSLVKIGKRLGVKPSAGSGNAPTNNEMAARSSDRRQAPVTLPRLRFMENPCGIRTAEHTLKRMMEDE